MKSQEEKAEATINAQPDKINARHRALMRRIVSGMTLTDACVDIGFTLPRASIIINSPLFQEEMKRMEKEVASDFAEAEAGRPEDPTRKMLSETAEVAAKTLKGALDSQNPSIALSAAKDILDRTGYAKEDKLKVRGLVEPSQALIDVIGRIHKEKHVNTDEPEQD